MLVCVFICIHVCIVFASCSWSFHWPLLCIMTYVYLYSLLVFKAWFVKHVLYCVMYKVYCILCDMLWDSGSQFGNYILFFVIVVMIIVIIIVVDLYSLVFFFCFFFFFFFFFFLRVEGGLGFLLGWLVYDFPSIMVTRNRLCVHCIKTHSYQLHFSSPLSDMNSVLCLQSVEPEKGESPEHCIHDSLLSMTV